MFWPEIAAALPPAYRRELVDARPAGPSRRVWRVTLRGRRRLALKLAAPDAPLDVEAQALAWLRRQGCAVPAVLVVSSQRPARWLALEWCGDQTLDDLAQGAPLRRRAALGRRLTAALSAIDAAFACLEQRERLAQRGPGKEVTTPADPRTAALLRQAAPWREAAPGALEWLLNRSLEPALDHALRHALDAATSVPPLLGTLDYHARNVIAGSRRAGGFRVVDFSHVGLDWAERRLVQYGTSTGAFIGASALTPAGGGRFVSVLDLPSVKAYAGATAGARGLSTDVVWQAVDAHDVWLHLIAAALLRDVDRGNAHPDRAAAWGNVEARRSDLLRLLCRPLAPEGPAAELRACLRP